MSKKALGLMMLKLFINYSRLLIFISRALRIKTVYRMAKYFTKKYILLQNIPNTAYLALTFKCQFDCKYCGIALYPNHIEELACEEWIKVIDQLVGLGVTRIEFTGGEPTIRDDLESLIVYAHSKGLITVLSTNGWKLDNERLMRLKRSGLNCLCVSIDGVTKQTHDACSGREDSFVRAVRIIHSCRQNRLPCVVSTILRRDIINSGGISGLLEFCYKTKAAGIRLTSPLPIGRLKGKDAEIISTAEKKKAGNIVRNYTTPLVGAGIKDGICSATNHSVIFISPSGEIQPCGYIPYSFGNIRHQGIVHAIKIMSEDKMFNKKSKCKLEDKEFIKQYIDSINPRTNLPIKIYEEKHTL
jgi:MoaA/NifB/PqqE/SkfB family radical SAM enzyme